MLKALRLAALAGAALASVSGASARAQDSAPPCEIHVSGGANIGHPVIARLFSAQVPTTDPALSDFENRNQVNATHTVVRALRLDTSRFNELVPPGRNYEVIFHGDLQDEKLFKRSNQRLYSSQADCYGDLMIYNLYALLLPASGSNGYFGAATPLLAGGNRMALTFEYHFFDGIDARRVRVKESVDVRLNIPGIDRALPMGPETISGLKTSTDAAFGLFLERQGRRLPSQTAPN